MLLCYAFQRFVFRINFNMNIILSKDVVNLKQHFDNVLQFWNSSNAINNTISNLLVINDKKKHTNSCHTTFFKPSVISIYVMHYNMQQKLYNFGVYKAVL